MRPLLVVQLDDMTPIASIPVSCGIRGIPGMAVRSSFEACPSEPDVPFFTAVSMQLSACACSRFRNGCSTQPLFA